MTWSMLSIRRHPNEPDRHWRRRYLSRPGDGDYRSVDPSSPLVGITLAEVAFRQTYGVTVLPIRRNGQTLANLGGDTVLEAGDQVIVLGSPTQLAGLSAPFA